MNERVYLFPVESFSLPGDRITSKMGGVSLAAEKLDQLKYIRLISFIFIIGKPGSGKTTSYNILKDLLSDKIPANRIINLDDFLTIQEIIDKDVNFVRHRRPKEGGFEVIDDSIYDEALREIDAAIRNNYWNGFLVFIQFARSSYVQAFRQFSPEVIKRSLLIYLQCEFETCMKRNQLREDKGDMGDHYVPRTVMERDYFYDDLDELRRLEFGEIISIKNESSDIEKLEKELKVVVGKLDRDRRPKNPVIKNLYQLELFD